MTPPGATAGLLMFIRRGFGDGVYESVYGSLLSVEGTDARPAA